MYDFYFKDFITFYFNFFARGEDPAWGSGRRAGSGPFKL